MDNSPCRAGYSRKTGLRVFQLVPRHLRRRAASHNIRRLPVRLRKAAEREVRQIGITRHAIPGKSAMQ